MLARIGRSRPVKAARKTITAVVPTSALPRAAMPREIMPLVMAAEVTAVRPMYRLRWVNANSASRRLPSARASRAWLWLLAAWLASQVWPRTMTTATVAAKDQPSQSCHGCSRGTLR
jgi:hypothetical protein